MRVGLISDLHIDINKDYPIVELTAETAAEQMTDVLVIAGDISETQNQTLQAIERPLCSSHLSCRYQQSYQLLGRGLLGLQL